MAGGVFGGLALLLAAVGLYGVMSYSVSESRRDIGLRMALGATSADLLRIVLGRGLGVAAGGVILGMLGAVAITRLVADLLYKVSPRDPVTFLTAGGILLIVSAGACVAPAWRAVRVDEVHCARTGHVWHVGAGKRTTMESPPRSVHEDQIVLVTPCGQVTRWLSQSMVNAAR